MTYELDILPKGELLDPFELPIPQEVVVAAGDPTARVAARDSLSITAPDSRNTGGLVLSLRAVVQAGELASPAAVQAAHEESVTFADEPAERLGRLVLDGASAAPDQPPDEAEVSRDLELREDPADTPSADNSGASNDPPIVPPTGGELSVPGEDPEDREGQGPADGPAREEAAHLPAVREEPHSSLGANELDRHVDSGAGSSLDEAVHPLRAVAPISRAAWQARRAAESFPDGTGPFLSSVFADADKAQELLNTDYQGDSVLFESERADVVELERQLVTLVPHVHEVVRAGMQAAVDEGYVPAAALARLDAAFTQTAIRVVPRSELGDDLATYTQRTDTLEIGGDTLHYDPVQAIAHELAGHKVSGGTFRATEDGDTERVRRGFVNYDVGVTTPIRHYGLDEAVEQHLILSYLHGELDVVDPEARADRDATYDEYRMLLAAFISRAGGIIDLKAITRGSFEDSDESGAVTVDRRTMVTQARAAYGPGAYYKLNRLYESIDYEEEVVEELVDRIHGPERNADGSIERAGYIDLEGLPGQDEA